MDYGTYYRQRDGSSHREKEWSTLKLTLAAFLFLALIMVSGWTHPI